MANDEPEIIVTPIIDDEDSFDPEIIIGSPSDEEGGDVVDEELEEPELEDGLFDDIIEEHEDAVQEEDAEEEPVAEEDPEVTVIDNRPNPFETGGFQLNETWFVSFENIYESF